MSRHDGERLADIIDASEAIARYLSRGDLSDELVLDAIRLRLIEVGEAVKALDPVLLLQEPEVAWRDAAGMRDWLAHHYFDTSAAIVAATVEENLPPLVAAVHRLMERLGDTRPYLVE